MRVKTRAALHPAFRPARTPRPPACAVPRGRRRRGAARPRPRRWWTGRPGPPWKVAQVPSARWRDRIQRAASAVSCAVRTPRNSRSSRSSASIVTFVSSSPCHQPRSRCSPRRWVDGGVEASSAARRGSPRSSGAVRVISTPARRGGGRARPAPTGVRREVDAGQGPSRRARPACGPPRSPRPGHRASSTSAARRRRSGLLGGAVARDALARVRPLPRHHGRSTASARRPPAVAQRVGHRQRLLP